MGSKCQRNIIEDINPRWYEFLPISCVLLHLCVYLGVYICYGILKGDIKNYTKPTIVMKNMIFFSKINIFKMIIKSIPFFKNDLLCLIWLKSKLNMFIWNLKINYLIKTNIIYVEHVVYVAPKWNCST